MIGEKTGSFQNTECWIVLFCPVRVILLLSLLSSLSWDVGLYGSHHSVPLSSGFQVDSALGGPKRRSERV